MTSRRKTDVEDASRRRRHARQQRRLRHACQGLLLDFTKCLGTDNQPIVFLFHDLHWADDKSLDLIDTFFTNANALRFYLVISQRSGMHVKNERFSQFIEKFRAAPPLHRG